MNAVEIEEAVSALAAEPFDAGEFSFAFMRAFDAKDTTIKRLRKGETNKSDAGGILWRNNIHFAVAELGRTVETLTALRESPQTSKQKAKFILATDGEQVEAEELGSGEVMSCRLTDLGNHFGFFLPLAGISTVAEVKNNPIDIKATGRLNRLYVQLLRDNAEWGTAAKRGDLNRFMARLIFCFFAEDTGIFVGDDLFTATLRQMSDPDGSNTAAVLAELFRAMNLDPRRGQRAGVRPWADVFPFVNGGLFQDDIGCPRFTRTSRAYLLRAGELDWRTINPDIFGSMIQAVADDEERGALGMHYTSVPNIQKVLDPLFLDDLREGLEAAGTNARKLLNLRRRLSRIRVFDPACGSGNFLVIAYIRMREIEAEIMARRSEAPERSAIALTQFHGIEIKSFAAEVARLSLLIAEFQCDERFIGQTEARALVLPLHATGRIVTGNALRLDWEEVCPPARASVEEHDLGGPTGRLALEGGGEEWETHICGNPPYKGGTEQELVQKDDLEFLLSPHFKVWRSLDYILGFFFKARRYLSTCTASAAFVTTNSVCQGEQVFRFWPTILTDGVKIFFAVTSFRWRNLAKYNAGVSVCVVGLSSKPCRPKYIESRVGEVRTVENINAYLVPYKDVYVQNSMRPLQGLHAVVNGNKPADGGGLIFNRDIATTLRSDDPNVPSVIRPFFGAHDATQGSSRYCIWATQEEYSRLRFVPSFMSRFEIVREMRKKSDKPLTKNGTDRPFEFQQVRQRGNERVFQVPRHSSETRKFYPVVILPEGAIVSDAAFAFYNPPLWNISMMLSRMSLMWIATVCGKIKDDFRFSNTLGWNTFPVPPFTERNKADLTRCAEDILLAREPHFPATIAELYDPERMPDDLRAAHDRNDETLERIYIGRRFRNDTERLETLFDMYTKMTAKAADASA